MRWFRKEPPPEKSIGSYLSEAERKLVSSLITDDDDLERSSSVERVQKKLQAIEQLHKIQLERDLKSRKKSFIDSPAGASLLTGFLTITASQMPAIIQLQTAERTSRTELLKPITNAIVKDQSLDLNTKLALISAVQDGRIKRTLVEEVSQEVANRKKKILLNAAEHHSSESPTAPEIQQKRPSEPNKALQPTAPADGRSGG